MELNHRPHAYQACALTELSYRPPVVLDLRRRTFGFKRNESIRNPFSEIQNPIEPTQTSDQRAMLDLSKLNSDGTVVELLTFQKIVPDKQVHP